MVDGEQLGVGRGTSKKDAEQDAAREALELIADEPSIAPAADA